MRASSGSWIGFVTAEVVGSKVRRKLLKWVGRQKSKADAETAPALALAQTRAPKKVYRKEFRLLNPSEQKKRSPTFVIKQCDSNGLNSLMTSTHEQLQSHLISRQIGSRTTSRCGLECKCLFLVQSAFSTGDQFSSRKGAWRGTIA